MAKKKRTKALRPVQSGPTEPPPTHVEWLWIGGFCILIGLILTFARAGRPQPVPPGTPGAQHAAILVSANDMRVQGWLTLSGGVCALGYYYRKRYGTARKESLDKANLAG
jgi:hypothetical protein